MGAGDSDDPLQMTPSRVGLVVPTRNAGDRWRLFLHALCNQAFIPGRLLVIDSSSEDETASLARAHGFDVRVISAESFDHAATRQLGADLLPGADILIYMTQDAVLATDQALPRLLRAFRDPSVGAVYGRQLPRDKADAIEAHSRSFSYGERSSVKSIDDVPRAGLRAAFISNAFAAYRRTALRAVGGFPPCAIGSEDMYVGARLILAGWQIAYRGDACVYHSHGYTPWQEFQRYFDIGAFHSHEPWIRKAFGKPEGEGIRYMRSEAAYLRSHAAPWVLAEAVLRSGLKYLGFRIGLLSRWLPRALSTALSGHRSFWRNARAAEGQARGRWDLQVLRAGTERSRVADPQRGRPMGGEETVQRGPRMVARSASTWIGPCGRQRRVTHYED